MATELNFDADLSSDATVLTITEETGQYSPLNTGGWNAPNPDVTTALTALIKVSKRNSDGTFGVETDVDVFDDLPSDIGGEKEISAEDAGEGATFPDAIYRLTYNVTGDDGGTPYDVSTTEYFAFTPNIDCCVQKLEAKVAACSCGCDEITEKFNYISQLYGLMNSAEACGDMDGIQKYIDILTKECASCGCNCS